jgi:putative exosortase-associated protein (TIGR04073 family)
MTSRLERAYELRSRTRRLQAALILAVGLAIPGPGAAAADDTALTKAGRGLAGVSCGFLELPGNVALETRRRGPAFGFTLGIAKGLGGIVVRELVSVYELVSAPIDVPSGYRPLLNPEYPWDYFEEGETIADDRYPVASPGLGSRAGAEVSTAAATGSR